MAALEASLAAVRADGGGDDAPAALPAKAPAKAPAKRTRATKADGAPKRPAKAKR
jgi:hypothetical protein